MTHQPIPKPWAASARALISALTATHVSQREYYRLLKVHADDVDEQTRGHFDAAEVAPVGEAAITARLRECIASANLAGIAACAIRCKQFCFDFEDDDF